MMQSGRFGRQSHRGGGRGGRGRGGRDNHQSNKNGYSSSTSGIKAGILNFPIGSSPSPGDVQKWMVGFATIAALECPKSGVAKIINDDGTIAAYPTKDEPDAPNPKDEVARVRYSSQIKRYDDWVEDLAEEKRKLVALIKSKLGPDSLNRIRSTTNGSKAIKDDDPKLFLEEIYATHNTDLLLDKAQNVVMAEKRFNAIQQGDQEDLIVYFDRFKAIRQALSNALTNNGEDPKKRMPTEANQAVLFIVGLSGIYRTFKRSFVDGTSTEGYPTTLAAAYERAQRASTDMITYRKYDYRGVFLAERGGRGGRGRGRGRNNERRNEEDNGRGGGDESRPRTCYICKLTGHYAAQCPDRDDAVINQALQGNA